MTLEPAETVSRADLDTYAEIIAQICDEAYEEPRGGPRLAAPLEPSTRSTLDGLDDPDRWALTWRAWQRKRGMRIPLERFRQKRYSPAH